MVTGGGAMHLNDSLGQCPGIEYVCTLHEQAAAMAAESYAKVVERLGVCLVTAGPGGTNAITGVAGAWLDSTPMLVLSGQVKRADLKGESGVRQMGVQEVDIVSMVAPITKYAVTVMDPTRHPLPHGKGACTSRAPDGPVRCGSTFRSTCRARDRRDRRCARFDPRDDRARRAPSRRREIAAAVQRTIELLNDAERPVVLIGNGVRLGGARAEMRALIERLGLPVLTTWPAHDMVPDDHPLMAGRPGPLAPRGANFTLQNADWLLSLGARLDLVVTGYAPRNFARAAKKIMVDIDAAELRKMGGTIDVPVCADVKAFIVEMTRQLDARAGARSRARGARAARDWKTKYPVVAARVPQSADGVSTYVLAEAIAEASAPDDVIVSGSSGAGIEIFCLARDAEGRTAPVPDDRARRDGERHSRSSSARCLANGRRRTIVRRRRRRPAAQHPGAADHPRACSCRSSCSC